MLVDHMIMDNFEEGDFDIFKVQLLKNNHYRNLMTIENQSLSIRFRFTKGKAVQSQKC